MNINFNQLLKILFPYLLLATIAYGLTSALYFVLPKESVELGSRNTYGITYYDYQNLYEKSTNSTPGQSSRTKSEPSPSISNIMLKAIYVQSEQSGWIIVEEKKSKQTAILEIGQDFKGYKFIRLYNTYAVFEKAGKEYKLAIKESKSVNYEVVRQKKDNSIRETVRVSQGKMKVSRNYINSEIRDVKEVWKDISIQEVRKNGVVDGFKVMKVKPYSLFDKLGLEQNDIIKSLNGTTIKGYSDAFKVYNNMSKIKHLKLGILRNNELMELEYEIN